MINNQFDEKNPLESFLQFNNDWNENLKKNFLDQCFIFFTEKSFKNERIEESKTLSDYDLKPIQSFFSKEKFLQLAANMTSVTAPHFFPLQRVRDVYLIKTLGESLSGWIEGRYVESSTSLKSHLNNRKHIVLRNVSPLVLMALQRFQCQGEKALTQLLYEELNVFAKHHSILKLSKELENIAVDTLSLDLNMREEFSPFFSDKNPYQSMVFFTKHCSVLPLEEQERFLWTVNHFFCSWAYQERKIVLREVLNERFSTLALPFFLKILNKKNIRHFAAAIQQVTGKYFRAIPKGDQLRPTLRIKNNPQASFPIKTPSTKIHTNKISKKNNIKPLKKAVYNSNKSILFFLNLINVMKNDFNEQIKKLEQGVIVSPCKEIAQKIFSIILNPNNKLSGLCYYLGNDILKNEIHKFFEIHLEHELLEKNKITTAGKKIIKLLIEHILRNPLEENLTPLSLEICLNDAYYLILELYKKEIVECFELYDPSLRLHSNLIILIGKCTPYFSTRIDPITQDFIIENMKSFKETLMQNLIIYDYSRLINTKNTIDKFIRLWYTSSDTSSEISLKRMQEIKEYSKLSYPYFIKDFLVALESEAAQQWFEQFKFKHNTLTPAQFAQYVKKTLEL